MKKGRMLKLLSVLLVLCMMLTMLPVTAFAKGGGNKPGHGGPGGDEHTCELTYVEAKASTCIEKGSQEYWTCTCGKSYSDEEGTNEIKKDEKDSLKLPLDPSNHAKAIKYTPAGPNGKDGHKAFYPCCQKDKDITPVPHTYDDGVCICGVAEPHTHTFEDEWSYNDKDHWHAATCGHEEKAQVGKHTGGEASCKDKAKCSTCGQPYGNLDPNSHAQSPVYDNMGDEGHKVYYPCCQLESGAKLEKHNFNIDDGVKCACGQINWKHFEGGIVDYTDIDEETHTPVYICKSRKHEIKGNPEDHDFVNGKCVCEAVQTFTITYTVNNDKYTTQTLEVGAAITAPSYTVPEGYDFSGWTVPATMPAEDITVDATLTANSYKVTFTINEEFHSEQTFAYGATVVAPEYTAPAGHTFSGWTVPATMPAENITLDATLTANSYKVTFTINEEFHSEQTFAYGATVVAPEYTAPVGYTFSGWEVPATMPAKDLTLDATLTANSYKVTFNANGEEFATATYAFGKEIQDPGEPADYSVGCKIYTFDKWNETVPETMPAKDLNFYAVFTSKTEHTSDEFEYQDNGNGTHSKKHACCGVSEDDEEHKFEDGICIYCEAEDPDYEEPSVPSVPSTPIVPSIPNKPCTPIKPAFPNWGNIFDKWFGGCDKDEPEVDEPEVEKPEEEKPEEEKPSVPSVPLVPSTPNKPCTPIKPSNPIKPVIPGFGWIIKAVVAWLK